MSNLLKNKRTLIIDDYPDMRSMIKQMLVSLDVGEIDMVDNGKDAITQLELNPYDIIICDYNLGEGKNGQQVLEEAQKRTLISYSTIFIMITAESSKEIVMSAVESQPDDYLSKPFNKDLLRKRLEKIAQRKNNLAPISKWVAQQNYNNAIKACDALMAGTPDNLNLLKRIQADLFEKIGDLKAADKVYAEVMTQGKPPWAEFGHAIILYKQRQFDKSKEAFAQLIKRRPTYTAAYDWIAKIEEGRGRLEEAKEWLSKAVAIAPNVVHRQRKLGLIAYKTGDMESAGQALSKVVKLSKSSIHESGENEANLANLYLEKGDSVQALKLINSAKKRYRNQPESKIQLAISESKVQKARGNDGLSQEALQLATETYDAMEEPPSLDLSVKLSSTIMDSGDTEAATAMLQNITRDNHSNQDVLDSVQKIFDDHNCGDEGRSVIATTTKQIVDLNNKGVSLAKEGNLDDAKKLFRTALAEMPNNITIHLNNIQVLLMEMKKGVLSMNDHTLLDDSIKLVRKREPNNLSFNRLLALYDQIQG